ncbi:neprilysin-1-like [Rhipicephalus microplus]|uniref:neprilysin-1-like n=1 Tax=Rhipicephalus microplus TaxID=6941 RepID=UPI003F6CEB20
MVSNIQKAFREKFEASSWVTGDDRLVVVQKLANMKTYVGSAGERFKGDYVEKLYEAYPDVPPNHLFPSWIEALSLSSHYLWADSTTWLYDETEVNAFYEIRKNVLVLPTAIISRPLYYDQGPPAINYGALGAIRQRAREEVDDFTDSENLADFVGVRLAYKAFSSLPQHQRRLTLVGLNMSAERLFFIGHCFRSCSQVNNLAPQYAPYRSRCIVPLMNMPEFSNAFGCTAGEPMNPREKCRFWA